MCKEIKQFDIINFIESKFLCRFDLPKTITTDHQTIFINKKVKEYTNFRGIKMLALTPCYEEANGQVKPINLLLT